MRLDHLLSKEEVGVVLLLICQGQRELSEEAVQYAAAKRTAKKNSSGDALMGHTRSHPEHDG